MNAKPTNGNSNGRGVNWEAVGVALMLIGPLGVALWQAQNDRITRLEHHHDEEVRRNNAFENHSGHTDEMFDLYKRGMLRNPESVAPDGQRR